MIGDKYSRAAMHPKVVRRLAARSSEVPSGCIEWLGSRSEAGYGTITIGGTKVYTHRLTYTLLVGPIPEDLVIDHLCRNRACMNIDHLQVVTVAANSARTTTAERTHCPRGHEYSPENTRIWVDKRERSHRYCITCVNERNRQRPSKRHARENAFK